MNISPFQMAALAVAAVDGLNAAGTREPFYATDDFLYSGVIDVEGKHWIVRYPLTDHGGTLLEADMAVSTSLLGELRAGRLNVDVLRPEGYASYRGRRAVVYPAPLGKARSYDTFTVADARELGRTIGMIHALDPVVLTNVGMPSYNAHTVRERLITELEDATDAAHVPAIVRRRWLNMFDDDALWEFTPTVNHGDVADENFLWSENTVRTVVGFGQAHVGDPAVDLAPVLSALPDHLFVQLIEAYELAVRNSNDEHLAERATLMSEFALVRWLMHGVLTQSQSVIDDAAAMLEDLAAEIEADPDASPGPSWHIESGSSWNIESGEVSGGFYNVSGSLDSESSHASHENLSSSGSRRESHDDLHEYLHDDEKPEADDAELTEDAEPDYPEGIAYPEDAAHTADLTMTADIAYTADVAYSPDPA